MVTKSLAVSSPCSAPGEIHPLHALADLEGIDGGVVIGGPALGQGGLERAVLVVLHQTVDDVGAHRLLQDGVGGEVVHGGDLGAVELAVDGALGGRAAAGGGGRGVAAAAAAAGEQAQAHGQGQREGEDAISSLHACSFFPFRYFRGFVPHCTRERGPRRRRRERKAACRFPGKGTLRLSSTGRREVPHADSGVAGHGDGPPRQTQGPPHRGPRSRGRGRPDRPG